MPSPSPRVGSKLEGLSREQSTLRVQPDSLRCSGQPAVERPEGQTGERRRSQQVDVGPAQTGPHQTVGPDERQHVAMLGQGSLGQSGEKAQDLVPSLQVSTSELTDDERMAPDLAPFESLAQRQALLPKVVDPDRGVDQHSANPGRSTPRSWTELLLRPAQGSQAAGTLATDQRLKARMNDRRLLLQAGKALGVAQEVLIDVQGRSHVHQYARAMQMRPASQTHVAARVGDRKEGTHGQKLLHCLIG